MQVSFVQIVSLRDFYQDTSSTTFWKQEICWGKSVF